jgi:hypothetical protein
VSLLTYFSGTKGTDMSDETPQIPQPQVYEIIGRLYLQLYSAGQAQSSLVSQLNELQQHNAQLEAFIQQQQAQIQPPTEVRSGNPNPPPTHVSDALAQAVANGGSVTEAPVNEPETR